MCRIDDCDPPTVSRSGDVKRAAKAHKCGECRREIAKGEPYHWCFMVFEGVGDTFKICVHCQVAAKWLSKNCGGYVYDQVREEIEEHAREYPALAAPLSALANAMRGGWRADAGGLMPIPDLPPPITIN